MTQKIAKKLVSINLALVLLFTMFPLPSLAATQIGGGIINKDDGTKTQSISAGYKILGQEDELSFSARSNGVSALESGGGAGGSIGGGDNNVGVPSESGGPTIGYCVFYGNGGTIYNSRTKAIVGQAFFSNVDQMLFDLAPEYKKENYVITSYNTKADGSGKRYSLWADIKNVFSVDKNNPTTLYAQWTYAEDIHITYYDMKGHTSDGSDYYIQKNVTSPVILADENTFSNPGYVFAGWNTSKTGRGLWFEPKERITISKSDVLYAIWCKAYVDFIFDWDDNHYSFYTYIYNDVNDALSLDTEVYEDRIFLSWNTKPDGTGTSYTPFSAAGNKRMTLYAQYTGVPDENYYVLNANQNYNLLGNTYRQVVTGGTPLPHKINNNIDVLYWYSLDGDYFLPGEVPQNNGIFLYPAINAQDKWYAIFDLDGGSLFGTSSFFLPFDEYSTFKDTFDYQTVTKVNSAFVGFKDDYNNFYSLSEPISNALVEDLDSNVVNFKACYENVSGNYVLYSGNGYDNPEGNQYFIEDAALDSVTIADVPFINNDMRFIGWNTNVYGDGQWYNPGDTVTLPDNTVLYAQWGYSHVIYYYGENEDEVMDIDYKISDNHFTYNYYYEKVFTTWNTQPDGSGVNYSPNEKIEGIPAQLTLYAQWEDYPSTGYYYILKTDDSYFDDKTIAKIIPMEAQSETITLPEEVNGIRLVGWFDIDNYNYNFGSSEFTEYDAGALLRPGETVTVNSGTQLYAFDINTDSDYCTFVAYHGNGGTTQKGNDTAFQCNYSTYSCLQLYDAQDIFVNAPENKAFKEWNTQSDGKGTSYKAGAIMATEFVDLYAQWVNTYTVTFDAKGGSAVASVTATENSLIKEPTNPNKVGYRFTGWYSDSACKNKWYFTADTVKSNLTLYAGWEIASSGPVGGGGGGGAPSANYYTITATAGNGGIISPSDYVSVKEGNSKTFTITPNSGYKISDVLVDGKSVGAVNTYTFSNVATDHAVLAKFDTTAAFYNDVKKGDWFYEAVKFAKDNGLLMGTSEEDFSPNKSMSRGMLVTVLWRMAGSPSVANTANFTDVKENQWYSTAIQWAAANNIINGVSASAFGTNDNISRQDMVTMLYRYAQLKGLDVSKTADLSGYNDNGSIASYANDTLKWAVASSLINGKEGNRLDPAGNTTRAEFAAVLMRFLTQLVK